ncbi:hypothetical protein DFQ26_003314 [Actinomortierella ambigua]|nr:hypothetical protein DFQ26_003314 [Actinomortierella ambigua]
MPMSENSVMEPRPQNVAITETVAKVPISPSPATLAESCEAERHMKIFTNSSLNVKVENVERNSQHVSGPLTKAHGRSLTYQNLVCGGIRNSHLNQTLNFDPKKGPEADRDHNAPVNLARAVHQHVEQLVWPAAVVEAKVEEIEN